MICKYNCFWWHITTDLPTHILVWFWYTHIIAIIGPALQWPYSDLFTIRRIWRFLLFLFDVKKKIRLQEFPILLFLISLSFILLRNFHKFLEVFFCKKNNIVCRIWINDTLMIVNIVMRNNQMYLSHISPNRSIHNSIKSQLKKVASKPPMTGGPHTAGTPALYTDWRPHFNLPPATAKPGRYQYNSWRWDLLIPHSSHSPDIGTRCE